MFNAIERINEAIIKKNSRIVAGLDPKWDLIPQFYKEKATIGDVFQKFGIDYIDIVEKYVPAIKINSAFFEAIGEEKIFSKLVSYAKNRDLIVIGDVKRADIGNTSKAYAEAYIGEYSRLDAITINPYFGTDSVKPFFDMAVENDKGVFVLVKTSNKSSADIQDLELKDGKKVYEAVADYVKIWGDNYSVDVYGYTPIGAVVGATHPEQAKKLRELMPNTFFLVPGFGAQGATAEDVAVNFDKDGLGAIVNSSRGLMCAYQKEEYQELEWYDATIAELKKSIDKINDAINKR